MIPGQGLLLLLILLILLLRQETTSRSSRGRTVPSTRKNETTLYFLSKCAPCRRPSRTKLGTARSMKLTYRRMLVRHQLPPQHSTSKKFRVLMRLASGSTFPRINRRRVRHLVVEIYIATKEVSLLDVPA